MIDYENMRLAVVKGLKKYLGCTIIRGNQGKEPPAYPYLSYTITTLMSANNGTYGEYSDGVDRKPVTTTWSITVHSNDNIESVALANKAREWLDHVGTVFLNDNGVVVRSVGAVTNRDNVISVGYESKNGFDVVFWGYDEVEREIEIIESIEGLEIGEYGSMKPNNDCDEQNKDLEGRLDGKLLGAVDYEPIECDNTCDESNEILEGRLDGNL